MQFKTDERWAHGRCARRALIVLEPTVTMLGRVRPCRHMGWDAPCGIGRPLGALTLPRCHALSVTRL
jgi:hypothetical protein